MSKKRRSYAEMQATYHSLPGGTIEVIDAVMELFDTLEKHEESM